MDRIEDEQREWVAEAMRRHERPLVAYAFRLTGDIERARDIVQDAFVRLVKADRGKVDGHLATWLYTVCRNRSIDMNRKERRMLRDGSDALARLPSLEVPLPTLAEDEDAHAAVRRAMSDLPSQQQEVLRLKFQGGLSYREIAEITGLTTTNVGYHIHAGLARVRQRMAAESASAPRSEA
jgi:RNA polymerase sigma-70 factor (ECF subfamily)